MTIIYKTNKYIVVMKLMRYFRVSAFPICACAVFVTMMTYTQVLYIALLCNSGKQWQQERSRRRMRDPHINKAVCIQCSCTQRLCRSACLAAHAQYNAFAATDKPSANLNTSQTAMLSQPATLLCFYLHEPISMHCTAYTDIAPTESSVHTKCQQS
jgi:hypothetical protein